MHYFTARSLSTYLWSVIFTFSDITDFTFLGFCFTFPSSQCLLGHVFLAKKMTEDAIFFPTDHVFFFFILRNLRFW